MLARFSLLSKAEGYALIRHSQGVYQGGQSGGLIATAGVVQKISRKWWAPVSEDLNQTPLCNQATDGVFHRSSDSYSTQHGLDDEVRIVEGCGALDPPANSVTTSTGSSLVCEATGLRLGR